MGQVLQPGRLQRDLAVAFLMDKGRKVQVTFEPATIRVQVHREGGWSGQVLDLELPEAELVREELTKALRGAYRSQQR